MTRYAITTENLSKKFGDFTAVDNMHLNISAGSIHGFVGPNGAGKTTTIKMLIGSFLPTKGMGTIKNYPIGSIESRKQIGYVPEKATFYTDLNAIDYLVYMGQLAGLDVVEAIKRAFKVLKMFELKPFAYQKPNEFSSGMKKKLVIAQSLMHKPSVLILDEPTANLDPETRMFIVGVLKRLVKEENMTVFISSHILTELELLVDEVTLINKGKIVLTGKIEEIRSRFKQGILEVNCSNNALLREYLLNIPYIDEIETNELGHLRIYTKEVDRFKHDINPIFVELGLALHSFNEEHITLDTIYQTVFGKGDDVSGHI